MSKVQMTNYDKFVNNIEAKWPMLFRNPYGGMAIGEGWYPIIETWADVVGFHAQQAVKRGDITPEAHPAVAQIKEKFGVLRIYVDNCNDTVDAATDMAESLSRYVCETCGNKGKLRDGGWIRTLCDSHELEVQAKLAAYRKDQVASK